MKRILLKDIIDKAVLIVTSCFLSAGFAAEYTLPPANQALLGSISYTTATQGETPASVAERYNIGLNAIIAANPGVSKPPCLAAAPP